jgi:spermidine dehydrogenase
MVENSRSRPLFSDEDLGMGRDISRRDFIHGVGATIGAATVGANLAGKAFAQGARDTGYYPPGLTGLRGSHEGSYEVAHSLRNGTFLESLGAPIETGETYDLLVVGGGISGLSAAHFYSRDVDPNASILILDPHDDFGGHAKRNEFAIDGKLIVGYGGSQSIDTPSRYYPSAKQLLIDVGIDVDKFNQYFDKEYYARHGARGRAFHFAKDNWTTEHVAIRQPGQPYSEVFKALPMPADAIRQLIDLLDYPRDWLAGKSQSEKLDILRARTAGQFLSEFVELHPEAYRYLNRTIASGSGLNYDQFPALDAAARGYVGLDGLELDRSAGAWDGLGRTSGDRFWGADEPYIHHFPDGNASIARLLVRKLVPDAMPGSGMEDIVTARADYARLDDSAGRVRIRLNSTVVRVQHEGDPAHATSVDVQYVKEGKLYRAKAAAVFLGCWNAMIPYIATDLPHTRQAAAAQAVKLPINYTNVLLRNWKPWAEKGINSIRFADGAWGSAELDFPVSVGDYKFSGGPDEPIIVHFGVCNTLPGLSLLDAARGGRAEMLGTSFEDYERSLRTALTSVLGDAGFDPARDIAGITVNRWPHGYARYYFLPHDNGFWPEGKESGTPADILARPFGRLAVGTTDRMYHGFVDGAIEAAFRGVNVLKEAVGKA